jgi:hypothetical protein
MIEIIELFLVRVLDKNIPSKYVQRHITPSASQASSKGMCAMLSS